MAPGTTIRAQVLRTGSAREIPIRLSQEPSEPEHGEAPPLPSTSDVLLKGIDLADFNGNLAERLQLHPGTQVGAAGNSPILLLVNRAGAAHFLVIEPD